MQTLTAKVTYVDALNRAVVLTENNEALVLNSPECFDIQKDDQVTIQREDDQKRKSDWKIMGRF